MRLIDADALKEEVNKKNVVGRFNTLLLIDNAPTVDCVPTEFHEKVLDETVGELLACQANLRPQGEWIRGGNTCSHYLFCSVCKFAEEIKYNDYEIIYPNYCANCGAEMHQKVRDCDICKHHIERDGSQGCESWDCHFEDREDG